MDQPNIPDLTFPMINFYRLEKPWDMRRLLIAKEDAAELSEIFSHTDKFTRNKIRMERVPLVSKIHEMLLDQIAVGASRSTINKKISTSRIFFDWAGSIGKSLCLADIEETYVSWTDYLIERQRQGYLSSHAVYSYAMCMASILDSVLDRTYPLAKYTRVPKPKNKKGFNRSAGDKQIFRDTEMCGNVLIQICDNLNSATLRGPLPIELSVSGTTLSLKCGLPSLSTLELNSRTRIRCRKLSARLRSDYVADTSLKRRSPAVNLRIEAEMLVFIAQTSMNLQQAFRIEIDDFRYASHLDGYQVTAYKRRRGGEVLFEIFSEYRVFFERYLIWRNEWFSGSEDNRLFPFFRHDGNPNKAPQFDRVKAVFKELGHKYVGPQKLRKARVNWLARSAGDTQQVADMAQHSLETLYQVYLMPDPQLAMVEISRFHKARSSSVASPAPGRCSSPQPESIERMPKGAPQPDCANAAGCLFCTKHRDVDSQDHVWSLASYRYLKTIELARCRPTQNKPSSEAFVHPAEAAIDRVTEKLRFFEQSSVVRASWVKEALVRIQEEYFHPLWDGFIQLNHLHGGV